MSFPLAVLLAVASQPAAIAETRPSSDPRHIRNGLVIPDEGYCDQPYVVITADGNWLCTLTTGRGEEGHTGQHVVATISPDRGRTWSPLIDIEPADGPEASWAMPLVVPGGRVYVFYDYNGDRIDYVGGRKNVRADMLGWYVYKYSDDHGRTWSAQRYRLPVRQTEIDLRNDYGGGVQMFWGIGKPIIAGRGVLLGFSKIGKYLIDETEGWFFRSDNLAAEPDPSRHQWQMLPEGQIGLRAPRGLIAEEHNLVELSDGTLYTVYRTVDGHPCDAYSRDGGRSWTPPAYAAYRPGGRLIKHPRACPRLWKTSSGRYLLWFHNHGGRDFSNRNPAWILGGLEKDGRMHWSQPEILLYDDDPAVRISYPDLIEQDGRFWITETQKSVARVHEIDPLLLEGLWNQGRDRTPPRRGLLLEEEGVSGASGNHPDTFSVEAPALPDLAEGGGFTVELHLELADLRGGQRLLDTTDQAGRGVMLETTESGTIRIVLSDGGRRSEWDTDPGAIRAGEAHHLAAVVDAGPKIITFIIDGVLCDGGEARQYGWGRFDPALGDVNGDKRLRIGAGVRGRIANVRIHDRALRTSEVLASFHGGR